MWYARLLPRLYLLAERDVGEGLRVLKLIQFVRPEISTAAGSPFSVSTIRSGHAGLGPEFVEVITGSGIGTANAMPVMLRRGADILTEQRGPGNREMPQALSRGSA